MKPETKFDLAKIQVAILGYEAAYDAFETAYTELKEYAESSKEELRLEREQNHKRIHELELMLTGSPSQMLRDVEAKIKLHREKLNANWATYSLGHQKAIDELEAERERLIEEIRRTPATPEEIELARLKEIEYTFPPDVKEKVSALFDNAQAAYNALHASKESLTAEMKATAKAMEQFRLDVGRTPLVEMGRRYIENIKAEADALCK